MKKIFSRHADNFGKNESTFVSDIICNYFDWIWPINFFTLPKNDDKRLSIITDSIAGGSLWGGVGTCLIFGALLANSQKKKLRLITRTVKADGIQLARFFSTYNIRLNLEVEFAFAPLTKNSLRIDRHTDELFITTSWWTTEATFASVPAKSILYFLQEDERMFYPYGDEHLKCELLLKNLQIKIIVNTKLLFDHLLRTGITNLTTNGKWFEPAFPSSVYFPRKSDNNNKRKMMFYARPNNHRNLFYFGIELIDVAISSGILDLNVWDIILIGKDIPLMTFCNNYTPKRFENLEWSTYAELIGTVDLGLSLMYTPHPSYPPFDLAASGAVVVTNKFETKSDLSKYSANILLGELNQREMLIVLNEGILLAQDRNQRDTNFRNNKMINDWSTSFSSIISSVKDEL